MLFPTLVDLGLEFVFVFGVSGGVLPGKGVGDLVVEVISSKGFFWGSYLIKVVMLVLRCSWMASILPEVS